MVENSDTSLVVKYEDLDVIIEFSTISNIFPVEKAFERFTAELLTAFEVIKKLRGRAKKVKSPKEKRKIENLLLKVVQATAAWYYPIRTYSIECANIPNTALNDSDTLTEDVQRKISFEEYLGPFVRELGVPITALAGHLEVIEMHSPSNDKKQEMFTVIDKIIEQIIELLTLYEKHRRGEINLLEYNWDEAQESSK